MSDPAIVDDKADQRQVEVARAESEFVDLTKYQSVRIFWKSTLVCVLAMVAVLMDGYANQTPGNIIANAGFIKQFGTEYHADGSVYLNSHYVSLWGGLVSVFIFVGQQVGSIFADKFGRVLTRILFTLVMLSAAVAEVVSYEWKGWLASKAVVGFGQGLIQACTLPVSRD